jgi:Fe-S-cluster containining protein
VSVKKIVETSRCTGQCCASFALLFKPDQLRADIDRRKADPAEKPASEAAYIRDGEYVLDMIVPLPEGSIVDTTDGPEGGQRYTCRHWDPVTGNCTQYDQRPAMCRDYPYRGNCGFMGCTYTCRTDNEVSREEDDLCRAEVSPVVEPVDRCSDARGE